MATFVQFFILICAMTAACAIGFWVALQQVASRQAQKSNKVAQTIEQLRDHTAGAQADKSLSLIASDRDRDRVEAWRASRQAHPAS
jgi:hypothetical protein